ncbi:hypothetical protein SB761_36905, partial [Pseudomonas sp. SIMBA_064]
GDHGEGKAGDSGGQQQLARVESAHGVGPVVIGVVQVAAMVLDAMGAWKVGESGLCAMIERKLLKACKIKSPPKDGL